ncbi:hypothetical protein [Deinococcus hohokamensis]|uniref:Uncharacterized protein n=1 Tax=Deinococcus hohokamensis TaxID=309883 RepID=A0ABV9IAB4_9DEIO
MILLIVALVVIGIIALIAAAQRHTPKAAPSDDGSLALSVGLIAMTSESGCDGGSSSCSD